MNILLKILATGTLVLAFPHASAQAREAPSVAPEAARAMREVGAALRGLKGYRMDTVVTTRAALGGGRYREFKGEVSYAVSPPARLFAEVRGSDLHRKVYYDGTNVAVVAPALNAYALTPAAGTLSTFREHLKQAKGLELPVADLFAWGQARGPVSGITEGRYAGKGLVAGRSCEHFSYSGNGVLWDVWVDARHLPCRLGMVDTRDAGLPGYSADITWKSTSADVDIPVFTEPVNMKRLELAALPESDAR